MRRLWVILMLLAGCSSSGGVHWSPVYRQDIHTVAVPIFTTRDYHRGVEFQLTDAVIKKIEEFTPYKVAPRERADTILEGEIASVQTVVLNLDPFTATPQEQQYLITVDFTWKDLHTGKILLTRRNFQQASTYYPTLGEGQYVASENSVDRLAQAIIVEMEGNW